MLNFNRATWSFPEHNLRRWVKPTSIFLVIPFCHEQQACFRVCVVPMVPITFRFIIPLTWCHRRSVTCSWNLSTNVSWSSPTFWAVPGYQSNSWWEMPYLPPRWIVPEPAGHKITFSCWNCMTYFISCSDGSFVYSKSDLSLMTMSTLSRSMCVVLRSSTRTLGAQC